MKHNFCKILRSACLLSLYLCSASVYAMEIQEENWDTFYQPNGEEGTKLPPIHNAHKRTNEDNSQALAESSQTEVKKTRNEGEVTEAPTIRPNYETSNIITSLRAEESAQQFLIQENYPLAIQALLHAEAFAADDPSRKSALNEKIGNLYLKLNEGEASIKKAVEFHIKALQDTINPTRKSYLFERAGELTSQITMPTGNSFKASDYYTLAIGEIKKALEITRNREQKSILLEKKADLILKLNDNNYNRQAPDAYSMAASLTSDKERKYKLLLSAAKLRAHGQGSFDMIEACQNYCDAAGLLAEQGQYAKAAEVSHYGVSLAEHIDGYFFPNLRAEMMLKSSYYHYKSINLNNCHNWLNLSYSSYDKIRNHLDDKTKIVYLYNFAYLASKVEVIQTSERAINALNELKSLAETYAFEKEYIETMVGNVEVNKLKQGESLLIELASQ
ncbi:hypothetical protein [Candidatus Odyssella acanthamoebae]|uniref:Uncharacterized protein n=1 Tax=Candidatus Odyssella acanthamoebae TaxID=91604 RepID=A0A077AUR4_9PROT|nr:hypothetical protein [Candidatus Paracaedibacter acanthamoebae]AIK95769.1 hypothetical protein ID47_02005 [Candidatus Paracaedibacter acanthamoebae]